MPDIEDYHIKFKEYLSELCAISEHSWSELKPLLKTKAADKNQCIVKENQKFSSELFLVSGIVRLYYLGMEGEEINIAFYKGAATLPPLFTRSINNKHSCYIETLTDAVYLEFDNSKFSQLIETKKDIQQFAYHVVEKELRYKIEREKLYLSQNAQKRLLSFRKRYKGLENEIPHYHIASYLGISPVSLSRLRKQVK
ncbi:MAG: Crp/Fnr family transcriptional regulator [Cyclobacteriaceae bacterium]|nr:Crp/Fnr family transcriptional regulator [Cyclobacteriaceae bacterium]